MNTAFCQQLLPVRKAQLVVLRSVFLKKSHSCVRGRGKTGEWVYREGLVLSPCHRQWLLRLVPFRMTERVHLQHLFQLWHSVSSETRFSYPCGDSTSSRSWSPRPLLSALASRLPLVILYLPLSQAVGWGVGLPALPDSPLPRGICGPHPCCDSLISSPSVTCLC